MKEELKKHREVLDSWVQKAQNPDILLDQLNLEEYLGSVEHNERVWVLGAGKAVLPLVKEIERRLHAQIEDGIIIVPDLPQPGELFLIQAFKGAHPLPDKDSVASSLELLELAGSIPEGDKVICCITGGASSLLFIPPDDIRLDEAAMCYKDLLNSGASIHEINAVRKLLSVTAGGGLGSALSHTNLISVILSDVPGNDASVIGSGPTITDTSTFAVAVDILKKYDLWTNTGHSVTSFLNRGQEEEMGGFTPKPNISPKNHEVHVIDGARLLAERCASFMQNQGYNTWISSDAYASDVMEISKAICSKSISVLSKGDPIKKPAALIYYGESYVNVRGDGNGGRNQHLALINALSMEGQHPVTMLSFATDGTDGPTDAAGAIVNSETTLKARKNKLNPEDILQNFNSYKFHHQMDTLIKTGPTRLNLMDLQVVLIG